MIDVIEDKLTSPNKLKTKEIEPHKTTILTLPQIEVSDTTISLAFHTDTIGNLIRFARNLPEADEVYVKVRLPEDEQWEQIQNSNRFRLFLQGRFIRSLNAVSDEEQLVFLSPADIVPQNCSIRDIMRTPHRPETIRELDNINYPVGYVGLRDLINLSETNLGNNALLRHIGACTEFQLGSDSIPIEKLIEISQQITQYLAENDLSFPSMLSLIRSFSPNTPPKANFNQNKIGIFDSIKDIGFFNNTMPSNLDKYYKTLTLYPPKNNTKNNKI